MARLSLLLLALIVHWPGQASGQVAPTQRSVWAVVRIPSHGGSGVVFSTSSRGTWVLSAAHMFRSQGKPIRLEAPWPTRTSGPMRAGVRLVAVSRGADLALVFLPVGPVPYFAPLPPEGHRPSADCVSVGFDAGKPQMRPARVVSSRKGEVLTAERPWHGRSGGGLIERQTGYLVGICSGYTGGRGPRGPGGPPGSDPGFEMWERSGGRGIYVSALAARQFVVPHLEK